MTTCRTEQSYLSPLTLPPLTDLVIPISRSVAGQAEGGLGEGATARHDEGRLQFVLLDVTHQGGLQLRPGSQSQRVDGEGAGTGADSHH